MIKWPKPKKNCEMEIESEMNESNKNATVMYYAADLVRNKRIEWIICSSFSGVLSLMVLYLFAAQISFFVLMKLRSKSKSANSCGIINLKEGNDEGHVFEIIVVSIFACGFTFLRVAMDFRLFYGRQDDFGCNLAIQFKISMFAVAICLIYFVLWLRQRVFYADPRISHLTSKFSRFISWTTPITLLTTIPLVVIAFIVGVTYEGTPIGCMVVHLNIFSDLRWVFLGAGSTISQVSFLSLFIYPLMKHRRNTRQFGNAYDTNNPVIELIKRATIVAVLCTATDIIALVSTFFVDDIGSLDLFIYDFNLSINVFCMIGTFPDWRRRLMPWRVQKDAKSSAAADSNTIIGK